MDTKRTLAQLIADKRREAGLTQEQFAEAVGRSQKWASDIETGVIKGVRPPLLHRLAGVLHVKPEDIVIAGNLATTSAGAKAIVNSIPLSGASRGTSTLSGDMTAAELRPHLRASFLRVGELSPAAQKKLEIYLDDLFTLEDFQNTKTSRDT
ncbi:MAG: helix-turn-helix transcriptional regulator [Thermomicrobiales bacterium]